MKLKYVDVILILAFLLVMAPQVSALYVSRFSVNPSPTFDGSNVIVAVIDTGIDPSHPDLNVIKNVSFVEEDAYAFDPCDPLDYVGHGTHVAGIIAGDGEACQNYPSPYNQIKGVSKASIISVKVMYRLWNWWKDPRGLWFAEAGGQVEDMLEGIQWVIDVKKNGTYDVKVINLSIGPTGYTDGTDSLSMKVDEAIENGIVVVAAAGNTGPDPGTVERPATTFNVIAVGAVATQNTIDINDDILNEWSSRGPTIADVSKERPKPDVVAPGAKYDDIRQTIPGYPGGSPPMPGFIIHDIADMDRVYGIWSLKSQYAVQNATHYSFEGVYEDGGGNMYYASCFGTSMAAPHVAGVIAQMLHANPNLTPAQVKAILRQTAILTNNLKTDPLNGKSLGTNDRGWGYVDAQAAVQLAQNVANIDRNLMYDAFDVETPHRSWNLGESWDYLTFHVNMPSSTLGQYLAAITYHLRWNWGWGQSDYILLTELSAQHVWIDGTYYHLGNDMHKYLFSGPRIYEKGDGYVRMRAIYRVGNIFVRYLWKMHVSEMWLWLDYSGGSSWKTLIYINTDVTHGGDYNNYAYLPSTSEAIGCERKITGYVLVDVRDLGHDEYVQTEPYDKDNPVMWILRRGYFDNNPDDALNNEYTYNRDIVIYYQGTSSNPGPWIFRWTSPEPYTPHHMRSDQHTVNSLRAYKLDVAQSTTWATENAGSTGTDAYWGIRVVVRHADGGETEIEPGTGVKAVVPTSGTGGGIKSATWNCPQYGLSTTDAIVVRVYAKVGTGGSWSQRVEFITLQLGGTQLDSATWTVYYYTKLYYSGGQCGGYYMSYFYWGTTDYNSRIENFLST